MEGEGGNGHFVSIVRILLSKPNSELEVAIQQQQVQAFIPPSTPLPHYPTNMVVWLHGTHCSRKEEEWAAGKWRIEASCYIVERR
jgi:hypothetical protein